MITASEFYIWLQIFNIKSGGGGGGGNVINNGTSTDQALARFDGTTGKLIENSLAILSDTGNLFSPSFSLPTTDADGNGIIFMNEQAFIHRFGSNNNNFVGFGAGNLTNTGSVNCGFGDLSLHRLTSGGNNVAVGYGSCGVQDGNENVCLGFNAGANYVTNESNNICIGSQQSGGIGENNTIRLGNTFTHVATYLAGDVFGPASQGNNFVYANGSTFSGLGTSTNSLIFGRGDFQNNVGSIILTDQNSEHEYGFNTNIFLADFVDGIFLNTFRIFSDGSYKAPAAAYCNTRSVTATPDTLLATDYMLAINVSGAVAESIDAAIASGRMIVLTDTSGNASTNIITITPVSGTINGQPDYEINLDNGSVTLIDAAAGNWSIV